MSEAGSGMGATEPGNLGLSRLVQFAMGNAGKNALASMVEIYGLYYCTELLGVPPSLAGAVIMVSLTWDAIADPLIGYSADRQISRRPSILPFFVVGIPACALAFLAFFHSAALPGWTHVLAIGASLIAFRTAYTIIDIPHNCLLVFAAQNPRDRASLASLRIFFSAVGKLAITILAAQLFKGHTAAGTMTGFSILSLAAVGIFVGALGMSAWSARTVRIPPYKSHGAFALQNAWKAFWTEKQLRSALLLTASNSISTPGIGISLIFISTFATGGPEWGATAVAAHAASQAAAPLIWSRIASPSLDRRHLMITAYLMLALVCLGGCLASVTLTTLVFVAALSGFAMGGAFMLNWAYFADAIDAAQSRTDVSMTMSYFGVYAITNKICHGAAQSMMGLLVGYAVAAQSEGSIPSDVLRMPVFGIAILGSLFCCILLTKTHAPRD